MPETTRGELRYVHILNVIYAHDCNGCSGLLMTCGGKEKRERGERMV